MGEQCARSRDPSREAVFIENAPAERCARNQESSVKFSQRDIGHECEAQTLPQVHESAVTTVSFSSFAEQRTTRRSREYCGLGITMATRGCMDPSSLCADSD